MTLDQQRICEEISEYLEPRTFDLMEHPSEVSPNGFWVYQIRSIDSHGWMPLNYFTDEEANAKLLEAMPYPRIEKLHRRWNVDYDWRFKASIDGDAQHEDRKTAVVLAFQKFMAT